MAGPRPLTGTQVRVKEELGIVRLEIALQHEVSGALKASKKVVELSTDAGRKGKCWCTLCGQVVSKSRSSRCFRNHRSRDGSVLQRGSRELEDLQACITDLYGTPVPSHGSHFVVVDLDECPALQLHRQHAAPPSALDVGSELWKQAYTSVTVAPSTSTPTLQLPTHQRHTGPTAAGTSEGNAPSTHFLHVRGHRAPKQRKQGPGVTGCLHVSDGEARGNGDRADTVLATLQLDSKLRAARHGLG